jgi:hypothetical protein
MSRELIVLPAAPRPPRDRIDEHFDEILDFIERNQARQIPGRAPRRPRPNTVVSRRGKGLYPSPVAVAEFAGGEKIRMSFWQHAGKPWKFEPVSRWLCQIIGNERGRASRADAKGREDLRRKLEAARALAAAPGTVGEGAAAKRAMERLRKKAMEEVFDASSILTRVYPPATDCISFHIEHEGKRIDPTAVSLPKQKTQKRVVTPVPDPVAAEQSIAALVKAMETHLGADFLDTKAWRRVRARASRLAA